MNQLTKKLFLSILTLGLSAILTTVYAVDTPSIEKDSINNQQVILPSSVQISGFGTLSALSGGNENLGYRKGLSQNYQKGGWSLTSSSIFGAQIDWDINSSLDASLQLVAKDRVHNTLKQNIDWANLKYSNNNFAIRAGRMGVDIYMLSEYVNTSYAYLWARPIEEFYKPNVFSHFDGFDIAYTKELDEGYLQFKLFAGKSQVNLTRNSGYGQMDFTDFMGFNVLFENQVWKFRLGASKTKMREMDDPITSLRSALNSLPTTIWPEVNDITNKLSVIDKKFSYYSIGFSHESNWVIQSELAYLQSQLAFSPSSYSGYISIGKQFDRFTPYIVFSKIQMKDSTYQVPQPKIPSLIGLQGTVQNIFNQMEIDQQSISLGVRWDFRSKMSVKAQWTHTEIIDNKSALWSQLNYPSNNSSMDTISLSLDFIF